MPAHSPSIGQTSSKVHVNSRAPLDDTAAAPHLLRVLVVDDNAINLALHTRMIRTRFSDILDGPPVAVDSGLKALQLLRENVFDLILLDIQMPFLSGVDCTKRIRAGSDGILESNRSTTIIAVTTAIGEEPESLYRSSGFDGLISKPLLSSCLQELLSPLLEAARLAASTVPPVEVAGRSVLPPLPSAPVHGERIFFVPSGQQSAGGSSSSTTDSSHFAQLLQEQTRASLLRYGACAIARTGSLPGAPDRRKVRDYDDGSGSPPLVESTTSVGDAADITATLASHRRRPSTKSHSLRSRHGGSVTISQSGLNEQLLKEMASVNMPTISPEQLPSGQGSWSADVTSPLTRPALRRHSSSTIMEQSELPEDEPLSPFAHFGNSRQAFGHSSLDESDEIPSSFSRFGFPAKMSLNFSHVFPFGRSSSQGLLPSHEAAVVDDDEDFARTGGMPSEQSGYGGSDRSNSLQTDDSGTTESAGPSTPGLEDRFEPVAPVPTVDGDADKTYQGFNNPRSLSCSDDSPAAVMDPRPREIVSPHLQGAVVPDEQRHELQLMVNKPQPVPAPCSSKQNSRPPLGRQLACLNVHSPDQH